jgi:hypothetical protein
MKPLTLVLILSLAANAALLTVVLTRAPVSPAAVPPAVVSKSGAATAVSSPSTDLRTALVAGDVATLIAAGVPAEAARQLAVGRAFTRQQERLRALQNKLESDAPYWSRGAGYEQYGSSLNREYRAEVFKISRSYQNEIRQALGEDYRQGYGHSAPLAYLPAETRESLRRIEEDYGELMNEIQVESAGAQLPSDRGKLQLLQTEKERDIAALLGPGGYAEYQLRTSATAANVRMRFGGVIQNEEEFRQVYALQKAYDDRFNVTDPTANTRELQQARREAQPELQQQIAALLGPERYQEAQRANDPEYRTLNALATRLNLPAGTADSVFASRDTYATQSQQINSDNSLTREERAAQLRALAAKAEAGLQQVLGTEAVQTYAQRSQWLGALKNGRAFTTGPVEQAGGASRTGAINILSPNVTVLPPPSN